MELYDVNLTDDSGFLNWSIDSDLQRFLEYYDLDPDVSISGYGSMDTNMSQSLLLFRDVLQHMEHYFVPLVILVGMAGNTLSFVVFIATHLRRHSCNIYLASLALADNAFLFCVLITWSQKMGMDVSGMCQVLTYISYVSSFLSVWYVVAFTLERYIVVCFPMRRTQLCTTKVAKIMVGTMAAIALVAYSFALFTSGSVELPDISFCAPLPEYSKVVFTITNIDTLITLIIPTIIIIGCNIRISYIVWTFYKMYKELAAWRPITKWEFCQNKSSHSEAKSRDVRSTLRHHYIYMTTPSTTSHNNNNCKVKQSVTLNRTSHMRATRLLLIVSTVFVVCNIPSHASKLYLFFMTLGRESYDPPSSLLLCQQLFKILYYINFAVNFFLYSVSGRSFRVGLRRLKTKLKKKIANIQCHRYHGSSSPGSRHRYFSSLTDLQFQTMRPGPGALGMK